MSWTRASLLTLLVLLLGGVITIGTLQWRKSFPEYYLRRAERAVEAEDYESAKLHLLRLVHKHPNHAVGHEMLSRVVLDEARANDRPASYAANPAAIAHLTRAVELRPNQMQWRRRLLRAYLQTRQIIQAAEIAEPIYAADKTDGDAHLALTWRAVLARDSEEVERLFGHSANVESRYVFHEFMLKLHYYSDANGVGDRQAYRKTMIEAVNMASNLSEEDLRLLTYRDREVMLQILLRAQRQLRDSNYDTNIALTVIDACEKLQRSELLDSEILAKTVSHSHQLLKSDSSSTVLPEDHQLVRRQLTDRSADIASLAVAATEENGKQAPLAAFRTSALSLAGKGRYEEALRTLRQGISAAKELGTDGDEQRMQLHLLSGQILMTLGRFDDAKEHLAPLEGEARFEGWRHFLHGKMAINDGDFETAESEFLQARQLLKDDWLEIHQGLATVYVKQEEWKKAIPHMEAALAPDEHLHPYDVASRQQGRFVDDVHLELLRTRLKLGQWDESQRHLAALRETELAPYAWEEAIQFLRSSSQTEKAWKYLRLVRLKYPDEITFMFLQADILADEGKIDRAAANFRNFVDINPRDPARPLAMAHWFFMKDKPQMTLQTLDEYRSHIERTSKGRNTSNLLATRAHMQLREFTQAQVAIGALMASPKTESAGYLFSLIIASLDGDKQRADQLHAQLLSANARQQGEDRTAVSISLTNGDILTAIISNTYNWNRLAPIRRSESS